MNAEELEILHLNSPIFHKFGENLKKFHLLRCNYVLFWPN